MSVSLNWKKLSKTAYENLENGAYIAIFNWSGDRVPLLYLNRAQYEKGCSDYKRCSDVREAKRLGNDVGSLGLIVV